ncbi:hypothetical protein C8F01DRAFT_1141485 [Mycena amicta]|nr:hypothetical protein C8F01DRAFT_1141485 [Mycena amicta]
MLPQELFDLIVDHIPTEDHETLRAFSYAFRGLAARARLRVLRSLRIRPSRSDTATHNKCQKLLKLLETQKDVGALVQALYIIEGSARYVVKASRTLSLILPHLINLRHFSFVGTTEAIEWAALSRSLRTALKQVAPQLETLYLRGILVKDSVNKSEIREILAIAAVAKRLKRFSLCLGGGYSFWMPSGQVLPFSPNRTAQLESLAVNTLTLANSLLSKLDLSCLRTVSLGEMYSDGLRPLLTNHLSRAILLEEMNIWCLDELPMTVPLGLSHFPLLHSLRLSARFVPATLHKLMEECNDAPSLRRVVFGARYMYGHINMVEELAAWTPFCDAVRRRRSTLQHIEIAIEGMRTQSAATNLCNTLVTVLRRLEAQDLVVVSDTFPISSSLILQAFEPAHPTP